LDWPASLTIKLISIGLLRTLETGDGWYEKPGNGDAVSSFMNSEPSHKCQIRSTGRHFRGASLRHENALIVNVLVYGR
jgi:hypothetical protein